MRNLSYHFFLVPLVVKPRVLVHCVGWECSVRNMTLENAHGWPWQGFASIFRKIFHDKYLSSCYSYYTFNWCVSDQGNREGCVPNKKKQFFGSILYVALMSNFRRVKYNSNNRK